MNNRNSFQHINSSHLSYKDFPDNSIDWLKKLIAFDTTSRLSNLDLIRYVQSYCHSLALIDDKHILMTFNADQTKANLFISVPSSVKNRENTSENHAVFDKSDDINYCANYQNGIVLSGHTDVVPVDGQDWTTSPFEATIRLDRLYGRGACDMKGFIACALTLLPQVVKKANLGKLKRPIHWALSYDEEVGCLGAPLMLADIKLKGINPNYCIVGEPSDMQIVSAHKGINVFCCRVHGKSAHSSLTTQGVNAISYASRVISYIDKLAESFKQRDDIDELYDVPFSTLSVGTIKGGTATNIVPNLCEFTFDYRNLPFMTLEEVLEPIHKHIDFLIEQMKKVDSSANIELLPLEQVPAMTDTDSEKLQKMVYALLKKNESSEYDKQMPKIQKVAYATEGGQFTKADIATIICGPGSIKQAHRADEYIELSQLKECDKFLEKLLLNCCLSYCD